MDNDLEEHDAEKRSDSVIPPDTRKKVSPPNRFPWYAMGRIDIGCTGTFIQRRTVLTAAHCVYDAKGKKWYNKLNFGRKKDCDPDQGIRFKWHWAVTYKGWTQHGLNGIGLLHTKDGHNMAYILMILQIKNHLHI